VEAEELKAKHGDPRRTLIREEEAVEFKEEDLIPQQEMAVTLSAKGYIKRIPCDTYKFQHQGGKGVIGMMTKEVDSARFLLLADTHDSLLLFTSKGRCFPLKCHSIPQDTSRQARGVPITQLLSLDPREHITALVAAGPTPNSFLLLATRNGKVKKIAVSEFASLKSRGLIAINLDKGDELVTAKVAGARDEVILVSDKGRLIRFPLKDLRATSRKSSGVRGIKLHSSEYVVGMDVIYPDAYLLVVTANGSGKLTPISSFPLQGRGGRGILAHKLTARTGEAVAAKLVSLRQELMIISAAGNVIRSSVESIPVKSRNTQGISLMKLNPGDKVVSITHFDRGRKPQGEISSSL
jgi:DNA gyrase subunit A